MMPENFFSNRSIEENTVVSFQAYIQYPITVQTTQGKSDGIQRKLSMRFLLNGGSRREVILNVWSIKIQFRTRRLESSCVIHPSCAITSSSDFFDRRGQYTLLILNIDPLSTLVTKKLINSTPQKIQKFQVQFQDKIVNW